MRRILGSLVLVLAPVVALAGQECNVNFHGGLRITSSAVEFSEQDQLRYRIEGRSLWVGNRPIALNQAQADGVQAYGESIHALVPQAHQLTTEGVDLASDAMQAIVKEFSGKDSRKSERLKEQFSLLQQDIDKGFTAPEGIALGERGNSNWSFADSHAFESAFERNVQDLVAEIGSDMPWTVMKMLGWSLLTGQGTEEFEARMENFGKQMEATMAARGKKLEAKGQQLCVAMMALDQRESQLKTLVPELKSYDFISVANQTASR